MFNNLIIFIVDYFAAMISKKIPNTEDGSRLDRCIRRLLGNINQAILEKLMRSNNILLDEKKKSHQLKSKQDNI